MKKLIKKALMNVGYRIEGTRYTPRHLLDPANVKPLEFDDVICRYMFEFGENCSFIQIGAYDGITTDPLRKYIERCGWRGVMLEPQPAANHKLRELYRGNANVVILEAALDSHSGKRKLYAVRSGALPGWAGGMASFDRGHILKHEYLIQGIGNMVDELMVDCMPFDEVLKYVPAENLDLLQIDAEGADGDIIALFPFCRMRPAIVHWEIKNMTRRQIEQTLDLLIAQGYLISRSGQEDMLAISFLRTRLK
jgi:FkbM family methyltransferase